MELQSTATQYPEKAKLDAAVEEMLKTRVVRPSHSAYASAVVLKPKKNGSVCLCEDYHRLNDVTVKDDYPFLTVDSIISSLGGARVYHSGLLTWFFANRNAPGRCS